MKMPVVRIILGVSAKKSVEMGTFANNKLNGEASREFLNELASKDDGPLAVFMDNTSYHCASATVQHYDRLGFTPIFNTSYRPDLNQIKEIFGQIKTKFTRRRL
mmetsp:Transcript_4760/g.5805  ORF Transcript_4760/g.5805 Transcript_4760/m.5805 type:complete len:104 (+) Transcript_4760:117-428(+)